MLWKEVRGLTMKSLSGQAHMMLTKVAAQLKDGTWPPATSGTQQLVFELDGKGKEGLLVAYDYSGEDFPKAFVGDEADSPEVKTLLKYVDRAAAVILLIDPAVVASSDVEGAAEDDFGMVQAVQRIRNWHGGEDVPVVLALTKADRNAELLNKH